MPELPPDDIPLDAPDDLPPPVLPMPEVPVSDGVRVVPGVLLVNAPVV
jgi:hypothetical protein